MNYVMLCKFLETDQAFEVEQPLLCNKLSKQASRPNTACLSGAVGLGCI